MKKLFLKLLVFSSCIFCVGAVSSFSIPNFFSLGLDKNLKGFLGPSPVGQFLSNLKEENDDLMLEISNWRSDLKKSERELRDMKKRAKNAKDEEKIYFDTKVELLKKNLELLQEINRVSNSRLLALRDHIKLILEYKGDISFKKLEIIAKASYSFEEFEKLFQDIISLKELLEKSKNRRVALYNRVNESKEILLGFERKRQKKENSGDLGEACKLSERELDCVLESDLLNTEIRILNTEENLAKVKLAEAETSAKKVESTIAFLNAQLEAFKRSYERVKNSLYFKPGYFEKEKSELDSSLNKHKADISILEKEIKSLNSSINKINREINTQAKDLNLKTLDLTNLKNWGKILIDRTDLIALCKIGPLFVRQSLGEYNLKHKEALIDLKKAKIKKEEILHRIKKSWSDVTKNRLGFSRDKLESQALLYRGTLLEIRHNLNSLREKRDDSIEKIKNLNILSETIEGVKKTKFFTEKDSSLDKKDLELCSSGIRNSLENIRLQERLNSKLIDAYSASIVIFEDIIRKIENLTEEITRRSFWDRSDSSISLADLRSFLPDVRRFIKDTIFSLKFYWNSISFPKTINRWGNYYQNNPLMILLLLLRLLFILLGWYILRSYLPILRNRISHKIGYFKKPNIVSLVGSLFDFIDRYLLSFYIWFCAYLFIYFGLIVNIYILFFFYLTSIPYLFFLTSRFINYLQETVKKFDFFDEDYGSRFIFFFSLLLYLTIFSFFFTRAFMMGNYRSSAVPSILWAINYVVFQISLVYFVKKNWILNFLPKKGFIWSRISSFVDRYYYVVWGAFIALVVISNPYIGYGRQVLFIMSRLLLLGLIFSFFSYLYTRLSKLSEDLFFKPSQDETEGVVERFGSSRNWYGVFVVFLFFLFVLITVFVIARIFGYVISFDDIVKLINYEIYSQVDDKGIPVPGIKVSDFLVFIIILLVGFFVAYLVNNLILKKLFDPILITSNIRKVVFFITRYSIILIAIFSAVKFLRLESFIWKLGLVFAAAIYAVKEMLADFLAYFIIIIQRPVKVGDFIKIDDKINGIVREITPRAVILRKKNSTNLLVPNSEIISKPLKNWMYYNTFVGIDDLKITVTFDSDPEKVKEVILRVLDNNPNLLKRPSPIVRMNEFKHFGFEFLVRGFLSSSRILDRWDIASDILFEIAKEFKKEGIKIAKTPIRLMVSNDE